MLTRNGKAILTAESKALARLEVDYWAGVHKLAADVRAGFVIPHCDAHGLRFVAGMGGWAFYGQDGEPLDDARLPKRIAHALGLPTANPANDLGSLVDDYTPEK
ncbi:hypothetical protein AchV4_0058 [Achromobacter phage vB_AchrS_AchV4]|uniref:Uncharacterized protein n=1 Tax=Achromobacter phage vB_AchrS_AchV4 TaxID=2796514 RepID=A0A7T3U7D7_9CAUD|nr:hypothetical protein JT316_gp58 [Achromobacter phage vB_AchrS_AchV4]QPZ53291.1 hypothetical protein AchV4_0058 [Achromobacter phage vB_AchrS_AchV4]